MNIVIRQVRRQDKLMLALDKSVRNYDFDGRLHVTTANISKACVNPYVGKEIPDYEKLRLDPAKIYYLYRDPDELEWATATFNGLPLLKEHQPVTSEEHDRELTIGSTGTDAVYDHPYLKNSLVIWPRDDIQGIESDAKRQISCGYRYTADMTPGTTPEGEQYDGVMRDIVGNHVALVKEGRAGADVVVGDSKPNLKGKKADMAKTMTRRAATTIRYLAPFVHGKLAQDENVDLRRLLVPVTAKNWEHDKQRILRGVQRLTAGKLAHDASIGEVAELLDMIEAHGVEGKDDDESVSKAQHNAMEAAAHGTSKLGIPKKVGKEFEDKDKGKHFDKKPKAHDEDEDMAEKHGAHHALHEFLKNKVDGDDLDHVHHLLAKHGTGHAEDEDEEGDEPKDADLDHEEDEEEEHEEQEFQGGEDDDEDSPNDGEKLEELGAADDDAAADEGETDKEFKEDEEEWRRGPMSKQATDKHAKDRKKGMDRKKAKDEPPPFKGRPRPGGGMDKRYGKDRKHGMDSKRVITRQAMDAAIDAAVQKEAKKQKAIRAAERYVVPWVGELPASMSFDSASAVYATALKAAGVKNVEKIHPSAYRQMLDALPKPSLRLVGDGRNAGGSRHAMDSKATTSFNEMFPNVGKLRVIG